MGVRRAVETTLETIHNEEKKIATFGPLIHNPQVLEILSEKGVETFKTIPDHHDGTIVIRAHGVPPQTKEALQSSGAIIKDATCPRVVKVQVIIKKYRDQGFATIIIGDPNHAEVEGLIGYAGENGYVASSDKDLAALQIHSPYIIVSQTTQDERAFDRLSKLILGMFPNGKVFNTICDSTHKRQEEVRKLAQKLDALVVVGGKNSANTQRLGEIAKNMGCHVFMAETEDDLDLHGLKKFDRIGVTAGASTPTWMINRIVRVIESTPGENEGILKILFYKTIWLLLATNLYVALSGGLLAYTSSILQGIKPSVTYCIIAFGYLFAMHNVNRFSEQTSKKFNDPMRANFNRKYRFPLIILSTLVLCVSLLLTFQQSRTAFNLLAAMSVLGILYQVRFIPKVLSPFTRIRRLKEIPGSKTLLVSLAWTFVTVFIPALCFKTADALSYQQTGGTFVFVLILVFIRSALFDVFDVQGDRIVGRETLPVVIGEKKTIKLLYLAIFFEVVQLVILPQFGWLSASGILLIPAFFYLLCLTILYDRHYLSQGPKLEFALESVFAFTAGIFLLARM